jgi:rhamnosyl/mannosyltransferase
VRILHVYKTYLPENFSGVPQVIQTISDGLAQHNVESHVLTLSRNPAPQPINIGHHVVHQVKRDLHLASTDLSLSVFQKFRELARTADIVHYHFPWPLQDLMHLLLRPQCPTVVTYHSDIVKQRFILPFYRPLMQRFLTSVDHIVATSSSYKQTSPVLCRYAGKTSVIPIGVRDREEPAQDNLQKWRATVGEGFFLFIGVLRYYKGLPFLIDAARRTGLPVVVAGDGELRNTLEPTAPPNVTFLGEVSDADKEALLSLCSTFVFPSHLRSEAFGVSLVEAARAGKPMISCEIGTGTSYVNVNGETGLVVQPADVDALGAAMQQLNADPECRIRFGRSARERYERLLREQNMCESYLALYEQLSSVAR